MTSFKLRWRPSVLKTALLAGLAMGVGLPALKAQAPALADAPEEIRELAAVLSGKSGAEIRAAVIERLGPHQRDVGSGASIEQWDVAQGVLTLFNGGSPKFVERESKRIFHLLPTRSPVAENLLGGYEMTTLADASNHGMHYWLGNLKFGPGMTYRFIDSHQFPEQRTAQAENFFMRHPAGTLEVRYAAPLKPETLLESLAEGTTVAHLVFTAADDRSRAEFSITSSERNRVLTFGAGKPLSFGMGGAWSQF